MISQKISEWLKIQKQKHKLSVKLINLDAISQWDYHNSTIRHKTRKFFKITGLKIKSNFYKKNWDQPIIIQNEIGILGIIKNKKNNKYLLQAKVEPGNINKLQLAPTVQATKSNYSRVHGGSQVPYIKFFLKIKNKKNYNQSEQGFRYFRKFNSNILIQTNKIIKKTPNHYWFGKKEITALLNKKNIINMDTLSILSTYLKKKNKDTPLNNFVKVKKWLKKLDKKYFIKSKLINLSKLKDWNISKKIIKHKTSKYFSIIGISVVANKREVKNWQQPIIKGKKMAFAGLIKTKINETDHYLFRYLLKPGLKKSVFGCTVNSSDISFLKSKKLNYLEHFFFNKRFKKKIIYQNILSDEGGRFYQCQINYRILNLDFSEIKQLPHNYIWLSYNQVVDMISKKRLDIESRLLFASINLNNLI